MLLLAGLVACSAAQVNAQSTFTGEFSWSNAGYSYAPVYIDYVGNTKTTDATYTFDYIYSTSAGVTDESKLTSTSANTKVGKTGGWYSGGVQYVSGLTTTTFSLEVRAWQTAAGSYSAALASKTSGTGTVYYSGHSDIWQVSVIKSTDSTSPVPTLSGICTAFAVTIPEPSTIALGAMGLSLLVFRRRK